jgi:hypothetical protein
MKNLQDAGIDNIFFWINPCRKMYTIFSLVLCQHLLGTLLAAPSGSPFCIAQDHTISTCMHCTCMHCIHCSATQNVGYISTPYWSTRKQVLAHLCCALQASVTSITIAGKTCACASRGVSKLKHSSESECT